MSYYRLPGTRLGGGSAAVTVRTPRAITTLVTSGDSFNNGYFLLSGQTQGTWIGQSINGSGAGVQSTSGFGNTFFSMPAISSGYSQTNTNLVLSTTNYSNFDMTIDMRTRSQTRQNYPPNNWERATLIWRYSDSNHHYYFVAKNTDAEFGKRDSSSSGDGNLILSTIGPSYTEDLASGLAFAVSGDRFQTIRVTAVGTSHTIYVDGNLAINYSDTGSSGATAGMSNGKVGMASPDCFSEWDNFTITTL